MPVLTVIDTTGTQQYIFSSNRLRESIGASEIVARATSWWVFEVLLETFGEDRTNLNSRKSIGSPFDEIHDSKTIEDSSGKTQLDAEVIYAGGGNTLILFAEEGKDGKDKARTFARHYTKLLLKRAPGLEVIITHSAPFGMADTYEDSDTTSEVDDFGNYVTRKIQRPKLISVLKDTIGMVKQKKANRSLSAPLLGLAVTAQCVSTGGVATHDPRDLAVDKKGKLMKSRKEKYHGNYVSAETYAKLQMAEEANEKLKRELFREVEMKGLKIPRDLDDLGRTLGEASFFAVVHTDGNRIGRRMKDAGERARDNRDWIKEVRAFSGSIYDANVFALEQMLKQMRQHLIKKDEWIFQNSSGASFPLSQNEDKDETYFPLRPLIFAGDDLTFVCDGRLALASTAYYLDTLETKAPKLNDDHPLYSRAGVVIVKSHYPFRRAYNFAEDLARSAKERLNEIDEESNRASALDWHVALTGLAQDVREIRKREYTVSHGKLNMRPVSLGAKDNTDWRNWQSFAQIIKEFQEEWKDKRNKVKALREALRGGKDKTIEFLQLYRLTTELPKIPNGVGIEKDGWYGDRCGYFDAIEMIDLFFPLDEVKTNPVSGKSQAEGEIVNE